MFDVRLFTADGTMIFSDLVLSNTADSALIKATARVKNQFLGLMFKPVATFYVARELRGYEVRVFYEDGAEKLTCCPLRINATSGRHAIHKIIERENRYSNRKVVYGEVVSRETLIKEG